MVEIRQVERNGRGGVSNVLVRPPNASQPLPSDVGYFISIACAKEMELGTSSVFPGRRVSPTRMGWINCRSPALSSTGSQISKSFYYRRFTDVYSPYTLKREKAAKGFRASDLQNQLSVALAVLPSPSSLIPPPSGRAAPHLPHVNHRPVHPPPALGSAPLVGASVDRPSLLRRLFLHFPRPVHGSPTLLCCTWARNLLVQSYEHAKTPPPRARRSLFVYRPRAPQAQDARAWGGSGRMEELWGTEG
jgi:hypothetical protein